MAAPSISPKNAVSVRDDMADKIAKTRRSIKAWRRARDEADALIAQLTGQTSGARTTRRPSNSPQAEVVEAARLLVEEAGRPLRRDELLARLRDRGLKVDGKHPEAVLQTMLWRSRDRLTHLRGHGYWPIERPWAPAGHDPRGEEELAD